jgi:hypothetical protein
MTPAATSLATATPRERDLPKSAQEIVSCLAAGKFGQ